MLVAIASVAVAYESDTLTDRHLPLPDVTEALDGRVNDVVRDAIQWTNDRTGCDGDPERALRLLARAIHVRTAANELVTERGGLRAFGFDRFSAWIEKGGVPRRDFVARHDLFGSLTFQESPLLTWAGVCSTVRIDGVLVGTDKLDHFFEEGYNAWRRSRYGTEVDEAIDWATRTENGKYGLDSSDTFSFADLRADADGMSFYDTLLGPDGVATIGPLGCLVPTQPFSWARWIDDAYDEVLNPPVYTPGVQRGVTRHLEQHRAAYCASYDAWGNEDYKTIVAASLAGPTAYAAPEAPHRTDPYQLDVLCGPR